MPFPKLLVKEWGRQKLWSCEVCGKKWKWGWKLESHHKIPTHNGGQNVFENFELLCLVCHEKAHRSLANKDNRSADMIKARILKGDRWK